MADIIQTDGNGSDERVAYDLYLQLRDWLPEKSGLDAIEQHLTLYSASRATVRGNRPDISHLR